MKHEYIIKGDNIQLRPLDENDLKTLMDWRNKDEIREWFLNTKVITKEEQIKWFEKYIANSDDIMFIIEYSKFNVPVGAVALYNIDRKNDMAEFGRLMIGEEIARGRYIGYEATKLICDFAFSRLGMSEVYLTVISDNYAAIKTYEKVGFKVIRKYIHKYKEVLKMNIIKNNMVRL